MVISQERSGSVPNSTACSLMYLTTPYRHAVS